MSYLIAPIVSTSTRHLLNVESDDAGLCAIEVVVDRVEPADRDRVRVIAHLDDPDLLVEFQVRSA